MKNCLLILLLSFLTTGSFSQKVSIQKWVNHAVDSLKKNHVDTIEYYHQYCGECIILKPPVNVNNPQEKSASYCEDNGWVQVENVIIYQQNGRHYSLTFDCANPPIKKE
jgi:hypothetical protein